MTVEEAQKSDKRFTLERAEKWAAIIMLAVFAISVANYFYLKQQRPSSYAKVLQKEKHVLTGLVYPREIRLEPENRRVIILRDPALRPISAVIYPTFLLILIAWNLLLLSSRLRSMKKIRFKDVRKIGWKVGIISALFAFLYYISDDMFTRQEITLDGQARTITIRTSYVASIGNVREQKIPYSQIRSMQLTFSKRTRKLRFRLLLRGTGSGRDPILLFNIYQKKNPTYNLKRGRGDMVRIKYLIKRTAGL